MNETVLKLLIQLFALIPYLDKDVDKNMARLYKELYLSKILNKSLVKKYLQYLESFLNELLQKESEIKDRYPYCLQQAEIICNKINSDLRQEQKVLVLINLIQLNKNWSTITTNETKLDELIDAVAGYLKISTDEYFNLKQFINNKIYNIKGEKNLIFIGEQSLFNLSEIPGFYKKGLNTQILVLNLESTGTYLFKYSEKKHSLNYLGKPIFPDQVYVFEKGTLIMGEIDGALPLYYSELVACFRSARAKNILYFQAINTEYIYPGTEAGIHEFSFKANGGELIGIMGGSGAGKSTLLNLFNGNIKPDKGKILINGINIQDRKKAEGIIGYIPQDDLLIEDLSVYQNLYFNAELSFKDLSEPEIRNKVDSILVDLDLWDVRDLKVGSPLKKVISGGQRKRLNISLELIRNPLVLFVDEPTSGLSSSDAEKIIDLLKLEANKGSIVVVNIHQPSSEIFKQFDKLLVIDKGGYIIYNGDPVMAVEYFRKQTEHVEAGESTCSCCGTVNPDQILELVELTKVDEFGKKTKIRKVLPNEWYQRFIETMNIRDTDKPEILTVNKPETSLPGRLKQFNIFFKRNALSKIADRQFILLGILVPPVLALILGLLMRHLYRDSAGTLKYIYYYNGNIPAFFLMAIIVALFVGLIISAEDIFHDRKIRERERFLNLNPSSYLNSKVLFLFIFSAVQAFLFVIITCFILEIKGFLMSFWLIFFSLSIFGNLVGLNISANFKSIVAIYITIPLILVPQIILSGVIVEYDQLNPHITSEEVVPVIGDLMVSRWGYEALLVQQFKNNKYERVFFDTDRQKSQYAYIINYWIPELLSIGQNIHPEDTTVNGLSLTNQKQLMICEVIKLNSKIGLKPPEFLDKITADNLTNQDISSIISYLEAIQKMAQKKLHKIIKEKDMIYNSLQTKVGKERLETLREDYTNEQIEKFVLNKEEISKLLNTQKKIIQKYEPVFESPPERNGRAQFYSSVKILGNLKIGTFLFNVITIWLFNLILYIILLVNVRRIKF